jgi:hypothetical protein
MATQIVIGNNDFILIDNSFHITWIDKGKDWNNNWIPNTIHYVVYNEVLGNNEIQTIDPATGEMQGNTLLSDPADTVGTTTVGDLLTWGETRKTQITSAMLDYENAWENARTKWVDDGNNEEDFNSTNSLTSSYFDWSTSWRDYDEDYS